MSSKRAGVLVLVGLVAVTVAALGIGSAVAQQDDTEAPPTASDTELQLIERLGELEVRLPSAVVPTSVDLDPDQTWGTYTGDPAGVNATLQAVEADLRRLFVDADDARGELADSVALVARGWLDHWHATAELMFADDHDLAFPLDAADDGVASDADQLRGRIEAGLRLVLQGQQRLLEGYSVLATAPDSDDLQPTFGRRALDAEDFDERLRPRIHTMLSERSTNVWVALERFETAAPGVEPRARSMTLVCVDRELLREAGGIVTEENLAELAAATPERDDCPTPPAGAIQR